MPECVRCGDFTDTPKDGDYHYCMDCQDQFAEIEERGIIVEDTAGDEVHVIVTAHDSSFDGGTEQSQVDGLARGKFISDETGLPALFKYEQTGSKWVLDEYLQSHPEIRQQVHERISRIPSKQKSGLLSRLREWL